MKQKILDLEGEIELRGHHLSVLADIYFSHFYLDNRQLHLEESFRYDSVKGKYGSDFALLEKELFNHLLANPRQVVKLVTYPDLLCNTKGLDGKFLCRARAKKCEYLAEDSTTIRELGLKIGGKYAVGEILDKIKLYKERTGFESPRRKLKFSALLGLPLEILEIGNPSGKPVPSNSMFLNYHIKKTKEK